MAPLTRTRAENAGHVPNELTVQYYAQRASAGEIITEGTNDCSACHNLLAVQEENPKALTDLACNRTPSGELERHLGKISPSWCLNTSNG
jgi:hypothetical protein